MKLKHSRVFFKASLKLFIAYYILIFLMFDGAGLVERPPTLECIYMPLHVAIKAYTNLNTRKHRESEDYFPYIGPKKLATLTFWSWQIPFMPLGAKGGEYWNQLPKNMDEFSEITSLCYRYLDSHNIELDTPPSPPYDGSGMDYNAIEMPFLKRTSVGIIDTVSPFHITIFEKDHLFVNSLKPLIITIAPVTTVSRMKLNRKSDHLFLMQHGNSSQSYTFDNRIPTHEDLLWFSPDMDVLPQPLEKVSDNEQRIKVPWGWLVYKMETATRTMAESVCKEGEDKTYTVDYWKVYAEEKDYYDDF